MTTAASMPPPKVDPETLVLRGRPPRAIRFRRHLIIGIAAIGSASLVGITWIALQPKLLRTAQVESDLSTPNRQGPRSELSALPSTYGDVPKLGPPLPGDLGRPILRAQRVREERARSTTSDDATARYQAYQEAVRTARQSPILVQTGASRGGLSANVLQSETPTAPSAASTAIKAPAGDNSADASDTRDDVNPHRMRPPASAHILSAGSVIAASLITGLNSDLPGIAIAQVTQAVLDSPTGLIILIPQGSRLIGRYDNRTSAGQKRLQLVWQRILFPDGRSLQLDDMPATDGAGRSGLTDQVDTHADALFGGAAISTMLGVGTELALDGDGTLVDAVRQGSQQSVSRAGDQLVGRRLNIMPTIVIRPGAPVRLLVKRDLILAPWKESQR
jgi:type IV secretion system protein VirB10